MAATLAIVSVEWHTLLYSTVRRKFNSFIHLDERTYFTVLSGATLPGESLAVTVTRDTVLCRAIFESRSAIALAVWVAVGCQHQILLDPSSNVLHSLILSTLSNRPALYCQLYSLLYIDCIKNMPLFCRRLLPSPKCANFHTGLSQRQ